MPIIIQDVKMEEAEVDEKPSTSAALQDDEAADGAAEQAPKKKKKDKIKKVGQPPISCCEHSYQTSK